MRVGLVVFIAATAIFVVAWPGLDLAVTSWFWDPERGFFMRQDSWVQWLYHGTEWVVIGCVLLLLAVLLAAAAGLQRARNGARLSGFLLLGFLIGPGLIVNFTFKEQFGRARPSHVQEFGGDRQFTPALVPVDQCERNCSFASGHASVGFALMALGLALQRRRLWIGVGLAAGGLLGASRIVMGGHFLSDVVFSGVSVWFGILAAYWIVYIAPGQYSAWRKTMLAPGVVASPAAPAGAYHRSSHRGPEKAEHALPVEPARADIPVSGRTLPASSAGG